MIAIRPSALLAAALLATPALAADAPLAGTRLDLTATADVAVVPDIATISAGVVTQSQSAGDAIAANATKMSAAIAALKKAGIAPRDISTDSVSLSPQYRYGENQPPILTGYQASNQVSVRFREIARAGAILDALVTQGANQINGPNFSVDKPEPLLDQARAAALAKAQARAQLYARAAGMSVRRIVSISESGGSYGPPMPVPMMMRAEMGKAATPIEAGEQKLSISLSVIFELQ